jgi:hypothetical protein
MVGKSLILRGLGPDAEPTMGSHSVVTYSTNDYLLGNTNVVPRDNRVANQRLASASLDVQTGYLSNPQVGAPGHSSALARYKTRT